MSLQDGDQLAAAGHPCIRDGPIPRARSQVRPAYCRRATDRPCPHPSRQPSCSARGRRRLWSTGPGYCHGSIRRVIRDRTSAGSSAGRPTRSISIGCAASLCPHRDSIRKNAAGRIRHRRATGLSRTVEFHTVGYTTDGEHSRSRSFLFLSRLPESGGGLIEHVDGNDTDQDREHPAQGGFLAGQVYRQPHPAPAANQRAKNIFGGDWPID